MVEKKLCFVIMPFSKTTEEHTEAYWTKHFQNFMKPLIEELSGVEARRSQALRGDIVRGIITDLVVSPVVVAELTDGNPNVYWELGVRQSFKHGTVTIAETGTRLPFDIGAKGSLFYNPKDHVNMADFRMRFQEAIRDCLAHPDRPDSHVLEAISGRGTLFEIFRRDEATRRLDALLSEIARNQRLFASICEQAEKNQKDQAKREFITGRLRLSATQLLITNRYVDEDQDFFQLVERCWDWLTALNDQLNAWEHSSNATEQWIIKQKNYFKQQLDLLRTRVTEAHQKLTKLL